MKDDAVAFSEAVEKHCRLSRMLRPTFGSRSVLVGRRVPVEPSSRLSRRLRPTASSGLTLIEVVLSVSILSLGLVILLTAVTRCLAVINAAGKYQKVSAVLSQAEAEYPVEAAADIEGLNVEETPYPGGFVYTRKVDEKEDDEEDGLWVVRSRVAWSEKNREMGEEVVRYVFKVMAP